jgi:hypothetical protein
MRFNYFAVAVQNHEIGDLLSALDSPINVHVSVDVIVVDKLCWGWAESEGDIFNLVAEFVLWKCREG